MKANPHHEKIQNSSMEESLKARRKYKDGQKFDYEDDVPGPWKDFQKVNSEFFVELGSPGGAAKVGPTSTDHADVIAAAAKSE